jgi:hypothetical protein
MPDSKITKAILARPTIDPTMYSPQIQIAMQEILRTLANIDFEYQLDFEKLDRSNTEREIKQNIARKLRERHQERREPYIRLLFELQARIAFAANGVTPSSAIN